MSVEFEYQFEITTPVLEVEESADFKILHGIFLRLDSTTKNGHTYQNEEGEQIARTLHGMPVYYGLKMTVKPIHLTDSLNIKNKVLVKSGHDKTKGQEIGRVIRTVYDKLNKIIRGSVKIWNTLRFPDILSKVRKGWGFSIGGKMAGYINTGRFNELGKPIIKMVGMIANHLQLLHPNMPRGVPDAKVTDIEETINFDPCPWGLCEVPPILGPSDGSIIRRTIIYTDDPDTKITFG